jgi:O-antigen/teichoic acid export membrane protein
VEADQHVAIRRGLKWVGLASGAAGALDAITTVILLWRWITPAELGIATLASAMFPILDRLGTLGLGAAAVRAPDDRRTLSSIAWLALASAVVVCAALVALSGPIGGAFGHPVVGLLLAAFGGKLVVQTFHLVPEALLRRDLAFRPLSLVRMAAQIADAVAKLVAAAFGLHVWCFVIGTLASTAVTLVGIQRYRPWRPAFELDVRAALAAARFGLQVSIGELLYFVYTSMDYVVIGRVFGDAAVGAYRLAYELVLDVVRLVSMVTGEVAFAAFARIGAGAGALLIKLARQNLLVVAPLLVVIGVAADDLLAVLYPPLGDDAATAARILCVVGALRAMSFVLPPMLAGLGHARDGLLYNAVAAVVMPIAFAVGAQLGDSYLAVAWAWAAAYPLAFALVLWLALARSGVTLGAYLGGIARVAGCAAGALIAAIAARLILPVEPTLRTIGSGLAAAGAYVLLVRLSGADRR